jgi:hypothetical protein
MVGRVPYAARAELRRELRAHLEALIAARRELGAGSDEAVEQALAQFGKPGAVARDWLRARSPAPATWPATLIALGCLGLGISASGAVENLLRALLPYDISIPDVMLRSIIEVLIVLPGLAVGLLAPARAVRGTLYAALLLPTCFIGIHWVTVGGSSPVSDWLVPGLGIARWALLSCGGAALGERLRRWRKPPVEQRVLPA